MPDALVVNASPVIVLAKAGHIGLFEALAREILLPPSVAGEIVAGPPDDPARRLVEGGWGKRLRVEPIPSSIMEWSLGPGESEVLAVACRTPSCEAVLDDWDARSCARALGIPVVGTLGLILRAKVRGQIPSATRVLRDLVSAGLHLDSDLLRQVLRQVAGEEW